MVKNPRDNGGYLRDMGSIPRSGRCPVGGLGNPPVAWTIHGQWSLVGYSPWGHRESDKTEMTKPEHGNT